MSKVALKTHIQEAAPIEQHFDILADENIPTFLETLFSETKKQGGISALANKLETNRQHIYRTFTKGGNPKIKSLITALDALGYQVFISKEEQNHSYLEKTIDGVELNNENTGHFLSRLLDIAKEQGGISALSARIDLNRQNLYRTFTKKSNPKLKSLILILGGLGYVLRVKKIANDNE